MRYLVVLILSLFPVLHAQTNSSLLANVTQAFSQAQIVPDLLPSFVPDALVNIFFPPPVGSSSISVAVNVTPGALLPENQTSAEPALFLITNNTAAAVDPPTYLLALVDPDVPTPQDLNRTEFLHFLGGNFSVDAASQDPSLRLVNQSAALLEYLPPSPPTGSAPHRYVLLVYQVTDVTGDLASLVNATTSRLGFNLTAFVNAANLTSPVAGNYFLVGPDNSTTTASSAVIPGPTTSLAIMSQSTFTAPSSAMTFATGSMTATTAAPTISPNVMALARPTTKLPPGANRILFVKNLNYQITGEDLYDLFGRYGTIRQIRIGNEQKTKGTAFVVFDDVMDAKNALDHLNGFHLQERYIVVLYHMPAKQDAAAAKADLARREEELAALKKKHDIGDE
ncbi:hypothetical protein C0991_003535 [Blastosporella zonata]|nr:hypothetical protein C0991_003535 [Blastosporella zonata]